MYIMRACRMWIHIKHNIGRHLLPQTGRRPLPASLNTASWRTGAFSSGSSLVLCVFLHWNSHGHKGSRMEKARSAKLEKVEKRWCERGKTGKGPPRTSAQAVVAGTPTATQTSPIEGLCSEHKDWPYLFSRSLDHQGSLKTIKEV